MSIRLTLAYLFVAFLCIYAWKDWFVSLCGLILMMAVIHHEDMPTNVYGIQGLNLWNVLFASIFLAWLANRSRENLQWDMPRHVNILLLLYLGVILVGALRAAVNRGYFQAYPLKHLISDQLINTVKWVLPGVLLFDGCRSRQRAKMAIISLLAVYFIISVQVVRRIPLESALGGENEYIHRIRLKVCEEYIGYSSCDLSTVLAGASWAVLAALPLIKRKSCRIAALAVAGTIAFGQALTGGRAGYVAWGATGLLLCMVKWRKQLILAPVILILLPIIFPAAVERMLFGFGKTDASGQVTADDYELTSGRTLIWPHVVDKIVESPFVGYGRLAMRRIGLTEELGQKYGASEAFPHPHNMYLETLLDNGILGSIPIFLFWGMILVYSVKLFKSTDPLCSAVGGLTLSLMTAQLVAGMASQHFYPRESTMCLWIAMFLSLRLHFERKQVQIYPIDNQNSRDLHVVQLQEEVPVPVCTYEMLSQ